MIVPDASAVALLFADVEADSRVMAARAVLAADPVWVTPEHWHTEVLSVIRGLWLGKKLDIERAERSVATLAQMVVITAPTAPLIPRMWELRSSLSTYDAGYVAAAEANGCTLITADARIGRAGVARCPVQTV